MSAMAGKFSHYAEMMAAEGLDDLVIRTFNHYYDQLVAGHMGLIPEKDIRPVLDLPSVEDFPDALANVGRDALPLTILLKLNGGLGTGMGLEKAKSLLEIKDGLTFLDIIANQAEQGGIPLVLMDSFNTRDDSLAALAKYPTLQGPIPLDFLQNKVPKITVGSLNPALWPDDSRLQWCPPGHGDIYTAMVTSGMLDQLLAKGYRYAFVSNSDNLGAVINNHLLGYFASNEIPFMMEVADRTEADKKGGHLAQQEDGQLILRESAQCPEEDETTFQDITRHRFFNTNNLWINLEALGKLMTARENVLGLAMICNSKTVDPRDKNSTPVYQLETAMGSAIAVFKGAAAVRIPTTRFAPIKKTSDLLDVRSDNYILTDDFQVVANPDRTLGRAYIELDADYYKFVDDLEARFPYGPPSLLACERFIVKGDVTFGRGVAVQGSVTVTNASGKPAAIADGTILTGDVHLN